MNNSHYCIIMAGGIGSRFWPVSRNAYPKQFLDILGTGASFLQQTCSRLEQIIPTSHILVVTSDQYVDLVRQQLPHLPAENILAEPQRRNTAPCIAYATYKIMKRDPAATVVVAPSDHLIIGENTFIGIIKSALKFAQNNDALITLGIQPTRPETGYGYIQAKRSKEEDPTTQYDREYLVYPVKTFTEKPNAELAKVLIESGEFYWNSGIFVWSLAAISRQMERWIPEINTPFRNGMEVYDTPAERAFLEKVYDECRNVSIDYGVMEKATNAYVFSASFGWSDMGSWDSFYIHSAKDGAQNVATSKALQLENVTNSLIYSSDKQKLVVAKDLDNYLIVDTSDALLICPRDDSRFKELFTVMATNHKRYE